MSRIEQLREFLQKKPQDYFLRHALALELIKAEQLTEAKALLENILKEKPDYVGSYYVLGKLLEKMNEPEAAEAVYEKGMAQAKALGDNHTFSELRSAIDLMD